MVLEKANYIEHYGLRRNRNADGTWEPVKVYHSWDAPYLVSNYMLFKLQRHADHHLYATKEYQCLNASPDAPQLPYGYPTLGLFALCPPLWFRLMNPRIEKLSSKLNAS